MKQKMMTLAQPWRGLLCIGILIVSVPTTARAQLTGTCVNSVPAPSPTCTSIASTSCSQFYSSSSFPNPVTLSLDSAISSVAFYDAATQLCPRYFIYFCLALMPQCTANTFRGPCRSFCELVSSDCLGSFAETDKQIECILSECSRFPTTDCIDVNDTLVQLAINGGSIPTVPVTTTTTTTTTSQSSDNATSTCPSPNNTFFTDSSKAFATGWISFWSVLCFISTSLTILTFLLETSRFQYPWRPVVYLALVFNIHSLTYFFSLALGREIVTCPGGDFVQSGSPWTLSHTPCVLIFVSLYYTMMAGFIWWVILTVCWFLVAALKWSHESVGKMAPLFQVCAWVPPLLMTIGLLAPRAIGADELTGTCFVVSSATSYLALLLGVVLPLVLFLVAGLVFLLIGFVSILRVRALMQEDGKQQEQQTLEKLMIRIGVFVSVYIFPASVLIGCFVYELASRGSWQSLDESCSNCTRPNSAVFMVRVFMFLLIGVLTGVWIWSRKTLGSWQRCPGRCGRMCGITDQHDQEMELPAPVSADNALSHKLSIDDDPLSHNKMPSYSCPDSGLDST